MKFLEKINNRFQRFMYGRNNLDQYGIFILLISSLIYLIGNYFSYIFIIIYILGYSYFIFRYFSKNIYKRRKENMIFLSKINPILLKIKLLKRKFKERKTHVYVRCPHCKQKLRVPKGRGNITIFCPKCKESFKRKV